MGKLLSFPGRRSVGAQGDGSPAHAAKRAPAGDVDPALAGRLIVTKVVKSFKKRTVVRGVSLELGAARRSGCSARTAPARPPCST